MKQKRAITYAGIVLGLFAAIWLCGKFLLQMFDGTNGSVLITSILVWSVLWVFSALYACFTVYEERKDLEKHSNRGSLAIGGFLGAVGPLWIWLWKTVTRG